MTNTQHKWHTKIHIRKYAHFENIFIDICRLYSSSLYLTLSAGTNQCFVFWAKNSNPKN